jgi:hypothetical protein
MTVLYDARGNEFTGLLDSIVGTTMTDARPQTVVLGALNAEGVIDLSGNTVVMVDLRSAAANLTAVFEGTLDGVNYVALPAVDILTNAYIASVVVTTTVNRQIAVTCSGFKRFRVRISAYTSGNITLGARATDAGYLINVTTLPSLSATVTAAAGVAATLTIASPGAGLRHYITGIDITRNATAALAGTATLVITSTNLPGALAWSVGNAMAAGGTQTDVTRTFSSPLQSVAQATATTIVAPAPGAAVLWRITAYYYVAP